MLFFFDEPVIGAIKLTDEACADLNWTGTVDDRTAALTPVAGQELANNTVYKIEIDVQDGGGKRFRATITLTIKWTNRDGSGGFATSGPYEVAIVELEPPTITVGTVADGDANVDPGPINAAGFRYDFDKPITGTITLTDEAGANLDWIANVAGQTATLTAVAGQELVNETTYKIEINVQDSNGFGFPTTITFVTKPK